MNTSRIAELSGVTSGSIGEKKIGANECRGEKATGPGRGFIMAVKSGRAAGWINFTKRHLAQVATQARARIVYSAIVLHPSQRRVLKLAVSRPA